MYFPISLDVWTTSQEAKRMMSPAKDTLWCIIDAIYFQYQTYQESYYYIHNVFSLYQKCEDITTKMPHRFPSTELIEK